MLSTLMIASHNAGKVKEIAELLAPFSLTVTSAKESGVDEPEETGGTFAENAELKARHTALLSGMPALADDSGIVIPALGGAPGIYSARWAGPDKDFSVAFKRIETELGNQAEGAAAYFVCALCLCLPGGAAHLFEGRIDGTLTFPPRGNRGFGYDPIFIPHGYDKTFAEIDPAEKNRISHRARAFSAFSQFLKQGGLHA